MNEEEKRLEEEYGPKLDPSSIDELIELSEHLWSIPELRSIFERVGVHGDWTDDEADKIEAEIKRYAENNLEGLRDHLLLKLAPVVCRWVADGELPAFKSDETRAFLKDRHFDRDRANSGILTKKAYAHEVLWMARDLKATPAYWDKIREAGEMGEIDHEYWRWTMRPIEWKLEVKYGLINRGGVWADSVLRQIAAGNIKDLDDPKALEFIKGSKLFVRDEEQE